MAITKSNLINYLIKKIDWTENRNYERILRRMKIHDLSALFAFFNPSIFGFSGNNIDKYLGIYNEDFYEETGLNPIGLKFGRYVRRPDVLFFKSKNEITLNDILLQKEGLDCGKSPKMYAGIIEVKPNGRDVSKIIEQLDIYSDILIKLGFYTTNISLYALMYKIGNGGITLKKRKKMSKLKRKKNVPLERYI